MSNPEYHTCPYCEYQWRHGHNGSHSCVQRLVARVKELENLCEKLTANLEEVVRISDRKHDAWDKAKSSISEARDKLK